MFGPVAGFQTQVQVTTCHSNFTQTTTGNMLPLDLTAQILSSCVWQQKYNIPTLMWLGEDLSFPEQVRQQVLEVRQDQFSCSLSCFTKETHISFKLEWCQQLHAVCKGLNWSKLMVLFIVLWQISQTSWFKLVINNAFTSDGLWKSCFNVLFF